ncbi:hypothetical protein WR25_01641 [Diploscapter pachys]|uniref:Ribosomal RNA processing protein 1 homolog n=1 Tax=Diploscapter pachys TaxID=2018661 RepID=A0A2A2JS97_9BILA|nr:hypothetical protein WR25_01641 [Diploscapter pachys]
MVDVNPRDVEVILAQKLACGEPVARQRALRALEDWIRQQSSHIEFTEDDMLRLWKGLHYVLWMQDKMIMQEELTEKISSLFHVFAKEEDKKLFLRCYFVLLRKEWIQIDRWRMDKFLMQMRRMVRAVFAYLRDLGWKKEIREEYWSILKESLITENRNISESLKFHFASLVLDELDLAGGLTSAQFTSLMRSFAELLGEKSLSDYLFDSIVDEVFFSMLHQKSDEIAAKEAEEEPQPSRIPINYKSIGKMLFDVAKRESTPKNRRAKLYGIVKKFELAAADKDPMFVSDPVPKDKLTGKDFADAAKELNNFVQKVRGEREQFKKEKKEKKALQEHEKTKVEGDKRISEKKVPKVGKKVMKKKAKSRGVGVKKLKKKSKN